MSTVSKNVGKKSSKSVSEPDYRVKDLSLASLGRDEIRLAEFEMPGLMSIRQRYAK